MSALEYKLQELKQSRGAKLAERAAKDRQFDAALELTLDSIERQKTSALWMLSELRRIYGDDLASFPVPDSEGGNNPDTYTHDDDKPRSVLADFFDSLPRGQECLRQMEDISKAKRGKKSSARYTGMTPRSLAAEYNRWKQRQTEGRKMLHKAISLELQLARFNDTLAALAAELYLVDGKVTSTPTPIIITDVNDPVRYRLISVTRFLAIDVLHVESEGGSWEALFPAAENDTVQKTESEDGGIESLSDVETRLEEVQYFLESGEDWMGDNTAAQRVLEKLRQLMVKMISRSQKRAA
jgi:hypothetical protein